MPLPLPQPLSPLKPLLFRGMELQVADRDDRSGYDVGERGGKEEVLTGGTRREESLLGEEPPPPLPPATTTLADARREGEGRGYEARGVLGVTVATEEAGARGM